MKGFATGFIVIALAVSAPAALLTQAPATVEIEPSTLTLKVGETVQLKAVVKDADGNVIRDAQLLFFGNRIYLEVTPGGLAKALRPGEHVVTALSPEQRIEGDPASYTGFLDPGIRGRLKVTVPVPPLTSIEIVDVPSTVYAGTTMPVRVTGVDESGAERHDIAPTLRVSDTSVAETDGFGNVTGLESGTATLTASVDDVSAAVTFEVKPNPVRSIELTASQTEARTGDVIHFKAVAKDEQGTVVE